MRSNSWVEALGALAIMGMCVAVGCGSDAGETGTTSSSNGGTSSSGSGGGFVGGSSSSGTGGVENQCATSVVETEPIPVTMYIMFDKSGSMLTDQKWADAKAAMIAFFQSPNSAGLSVGLRFFPDDDPTAGCNDVACDANACADPLVAAAELTALSGTADPQQLALVAAFENKSPGGQTPMHPALDGAEQWAIANASPDGSTRTVVVLVTDGEPQGCNEAINDIVALAKNAYDTAGVLTYAIGMQGANNSDLDQIAAAGGTGSGFVIQSGSVLSDLTDAFAKISRTQLACSFDMPEPSQVGSTVDPGKVNVKHTPGGSGAVTIPQASGASGCGSDGGWYYDDPANPATIELCPSTCDEVQGDPDAAIEIVLGCTTVAK